MEFELIRDRHHPEDWRVEGTDHDSEGEAFVVIFSGFVAEEAEKEYFEFKKTQRSK